MYSIRCTGYSVRGTMHGVRGTVYGVQCIVYEVQCMVYGVQCTSYDDYAMWVMHGAYESKATLYPYIVSMCMYV